MKLWWCLASALWLAGCGYTGEPLPPALNLPTRVTDVAVVERGDQLIIQFSLPRTSTEGLVLAHPPQARVFVGAYTAGAAFDPVAWARQARVLTGSESRYVTPAAEFYGKDVAVSVKLLNPRGRDAGFSNFAHVQVIPALATPREITARATAKGVELSWQGAAPAYRVLRQGPDEKQYSLLEPAAASPFLDDKTAFGKTYRYLVQAVAKVSIGSAESELSAPVEITPEDTFPPSVPAGLSAVTGTKSVELVWARNTEPDLALYRVYRAAGSGDWQKIGETRATPNYSDRTVAAGSTYRYAVSAVDQSGNESGRSSEVTVVLP